MNAMDSSTTFSLTIQMGNEAMQTNDDVIEALRRAATVLETNGGFSRVETQALRDLNGNTVGRYGFSTES